MTPDDLTLADVALDPEARERTRRAIQRLCAALRRIFMENTQ